ncbi:DUF5995 family protein [Streptomyces sp. NBC_00690]|uniref:DUF5995 family protein n=1 Tax=Streptomyces sp. NBC_00690 TaxID=2975808 RepID=UPI002E2BF826|nr:DUF5995 family protein [Streptomyces sp. NBC_00690]
MAHREQLAAAPVMPGHPGPATPPVSDTSGTVPPEAANHSALEDVIHRMRTLDSHWPARDGVAVFNRIYLLVTEEIARRIAAGEFPDRRSATTLDVIFARRYLTAVDLAGAGGRPPACWRPLFQYRRHPGIRPTQFALAGINAHIGYDLAFAVLDTCRVLGCGPSDIEPDFDRVGDVLTLMEERIRDDLMPGPDLLEIADPLTHLVGAWSLDRAREGAWSAARLLWGVRNLPELSREFDERMDAGVGLVGRCLLTPWR